MFYFLLTTCAKNKGQILSQEMNRSFYYSQFYYKLQSTELQKNPRSWERNNSAKKHLSFPNKLSDLQLNLKDSELQGRYSHLRKTHAYVVWVSELSGSSNTQHFAWKGRFLWMGNGNVLKQPKLLAAESQAGRNAVKSSYLVATWRSWIVWKADLTAPGKRDATPPTARPKTWISWELHEAQRAHSAACWQAPFQEKVLLRLATLQREQKGSWNCDSWDAEAEAAP